MIRLLPILFLLSLTFYQQKDPYYNKQGRPSTYGINTYIKDNQESLIKEYEFLVDTLYDVYIFTENLEEDAEGELGQFYLPDYIVITNDERFVAYEFKELSKYRQRTISPDERTVKSVVFHELTHAYFNQILITMKNNNQYVSPEYGNFRMFPSPSSRFGAEFIEEGICEYMIYFLNESRPPVEVEIPTSAEQLLNKDKKVEIFYRYSVFYVEKLLQQYGFKKGIELLIGNKPPTYEEILNRELFYERLK
jgi:hypothetical protein